MSRAVTPFNDISRGNSPTSGAPPSTRAVTEPLINTALPGESPPAFTSFTDFSHRNHGRHNATRSDTFQTPTGIAHHRPQVPGRLDKRWNLGDSKTLQDICEMGFEQSAQRLCAQLVDEIRNEMQQVSSSVQAEVFREGSDRKVAMEAMGGMLGQLAVQQQQLQEEIRRLPDFCKDELRPFRDDVQNSDVSRLEGFRTLIKGIEERFSTDTSQVRDEVVKIQTDMLDFEAKVLSTMHTSHGQGVAVLDAGDSLEALVKTSHAKMSKVLKMQEGMSAESKISAARVQQMCEENLSHNTALDHALEEHVSKLFQRHDEKERQRIDKIMSQYSHSQKSLHSDTKLLVVELTKIQRALNLDFVQFDDGMDPEKFEKPSCDAWSGSSSGAMPLAHSKTATLEERRKSQYIAQSVRPRKRMRDYWTQTDAVADKDACIQTDHRMEEDYKITRAEKKKAADAERKKKAARQPSQIMTGATMLADLDTMKKHMRQTLMQPQYNVTDCYHEEGCAQAIATNWIFERFTLTVIVFNALWISVDTDYNPEALLINAHPVFQVVEHCFCSFFTFEILVRLFAFKRKSDCLKDPWFVFDSCLVSVMVIETWALTAVFAVFGQQDTSLLGNASILRMVRMVRMLRISRMAHVLKAMPELVILIKGIGAASRSVFVFFLLWLIIIYVFAVVFRQITDGQDVGTLYFETVPDAMSTLLLEGILPDNAAVINNMGQSSPLFWLIIMFFFALVSVCILYMLVGVLVDVVGVVASAEKEALTVQTVANGLRDRMENMSKDPDELITRYEFSSLCTTPEIAQLLQSVGVDMVVLLDMVELIYDDDSVDPKGLEFSAFVNIVLNMRGTNPATVKDVKQAVRVLKHMLQGTVKGAVDSIKNEFVTIREWLLEIKEDLRVRSFDEDDEGLVPGAGGPDSVASMAAFASYQSADCSASVGLQAVPSLALATRVNQHQVQQMTVIGIDEDDSSQEPID